MSNDLISRSALIEALKSYCGKQPYLVSENIWGIIKSQPTVYDVDKVIEQLEEYKGEAEQLGVLGLVTDIIEIVKAGDMNENKY